MNDVLDRIEAKLDKQSDRLNSVDVTLAKQHVALDEHMRRTAVVEEEQKSFRSEFLTALQSHFAEDAAANKDIADRLKPLEEHRSMFKGAGALLGYVIAAATVVFEIFHLLHK